MIIAGTLAKMNLPADYMRHAKFTCGLFVAGEFYRRIVLGTINLPSNYTKHGKFTSGLYESGEIPQRIIQDTAIFLHV